MKLSTHLNIAIGGSRLYPEAFLPRSRVFGAAGALRERIRGPKPSKRPVAKSEIMCLGLRDKVQLSQRRYTVRSEQDSPLIVVRRGVRDCYLNCLSAATSGEPVQDCRLTEGVAEGGFVRRVEGRRNLEAKSLLQSDMTHASLITPESVF